MMTKRRTTTTSILVPKGKTENDTVSNRDNYVTDTETLLLLASTGRGEQGASKSFGFLPEMLTRK